MSTGEKVVIGGIAAAAILGIILLARNASASTGSGTNPANPAPATPASVQQNATAMQQALAARGYCASDMSTYQAFQNAWNAAYPSNTINVDGYPGTNTMNALNSALGTTATGPNGAALTLYPWTAAAGWTAGNAPDHTKWTNCSGAT